MPEGIMEGRDMSFWFTADTHFGHENIIKYCNRPFKDADEMDETLIRNWNERVTKGDTVFHLGDFCFKRSHRGKDIVDRLNGDIILIKGNHDKKQSIKTIIDSMVVYYNGHRIWLTHYPEWANPLMVTLAGHVHEKWKINYPAKRRGFPIVNMGVDVWDFRPISLEEIFTFIYSKEGA
jgi:calcineurin-like phosphoesterase family protein